MKKFLSLVSILLITSSLVADAPERHKLDKKISEQAVTGNMHIGKTITTRLPCQPGCGTFWVFKLSSGIKRVSEKFENVKGVDKEPKVGQIQAQVDVFETTKVGQQKIEGNISAPISGIKLHKVTINVEVIPNK